MSEALFQILTVYILISGIRTDMAVTWTLAVGSRFSGVLRVKAGDVQVVVVVG